MIITTTTIVKQAKDQLSCKLDNETAILNLNTSLYFGLDEIGALIWQAMESPQPVGDVCRIVVERCEVDEARCLADLLSFLNKLNELGLIETGPPSAVGCPAKSASQLR